MSPPLPRSAAVTGINVAPMVDLMLVLLIIVMLVTPLSVEIITERAE